MSTAAPSGALAIIANPATTPDDLVATVAHLGPLGEPASFWSQIANDATYRDDHRRLAVFELLIRHLTIPITVKGLSQLLSGPTWLRAEDVETVNRLGGKIPVTWTIDDTVIVIKVFPNLREDRLAHWMIYLRVSGTVSAKGVFEALNGRRIEVAEVLEYALMPADPAPEAR